MNTLPKGLIPYPWPEYTMPRDSDEKHRRVFRGVYSVDGYSLVLVTVRVDLYTATVKTTSLPGGSWWRQPNAEQRRFILDLVLAPLGLRRAGRQEHPTWADDWFHRYPIEAVPADAVTGAAQPAGI